MEITNIFEDDINATLEVRKFSAEEIISDSKQDINNFFDIQKSQGWIFLKAYRENGIVKSLFVEKDKLDKVLSDKLTLPSHNK